MDWLGYLASPLIGLALGLHCGRLFTAFIAYWESTGTAERAFKSVVLFLLGGGGTAGIFGLFSGSHAALYLIGLAFGMIFTFFWPRMPPQHTYGGTLTIIQMSELLQASVPDAGKRARLILATLAPPKAIEHDERISEKELAKELEDAADALEE